MLLCVRMDSFPRRMEPWSVCVISFYPEVRGHWILPAACLLVSRITFCYLSSIVRTMGRNLTLWWKVSAKLVRIHNTLLTQEHDMLRRKCNWKIWRYITMHYVSWENNINGVWWLCRDMRKTASIKLFMRTLIDRAIIPPPPLSLSLLQSNRQPVRHTK